MRLKLKLKSIWLLLISDAYYIISNRGASFDLPRHKGLLEAMQDELEDVDQYLEETIMDLILEERDLDT